MQEWYLSYLSPDVAGQYAQSPEQTTFAADLWDTLEWKVTTVPSSVQNSDFGLPVDALYTLDAVQRVAWMHDYAWIYRTCIQIPKVDADEEAVLVFKGIDYKSHIYMGGRKVLSHEGMFSPVTLPLTALQPGTAVEIAVLIEPFHPAPETHAHPYEHLKARYSLGQGWDFAALLWTAGIWDEVSIVVRKKLRVQHAYVKTTLANLQRADTIIHLELSEWVDYGTITVALDGALRSFPVVQTASLDLPLHISSPTVWRPNGHGLPNLVDLTVDLVVQGRDTARFSQRVGLRSVEYVPCNGQGGKDIPLQLVINGHKIFLKGVNWVPMDSCPGNFSPERYRLFLEQIRDAGVNFVRVWGGGLKEQDAFFDLADEYGLMLMQEFPLACQQLARTEAFYRLLVQEVTAIIQALKHHPSIVLWSGGNEHYHYWDSVDSGTEIMERIRPLIQERYSIDAQNREWCGGAATYDEPSLALIGQLCTQLDDSRPYQITSAMEGEGEAHGIWTWNPRIGDHRYRDYDNLYAFWRNANQHLYSEAGLSSIANLDTIREVFGHAEPSYPQQDDAIWQLHHAFHAAWEQPDTWLDLPSTEQLFGKLTCLDDLVFANQWMQAEGCRFLIEEIRRKMGQTSGIVWWCVNEPWPSLAGNNLLDYAGRPKLAWSFLCNAFRPTLLSLRYEHCVCRRAKPALWLSHDEHTSFQGSYAITITNLHTSTDETVLGEISTPGPCSLYLETLPAIRMTRGTRIHIRCQLFSEKGGNCIHTNDYIFASNEDTIPFDQDTRVFMQSLSLLQERNTESMHNTISVTLQQKY